MKDPIAEAAGNQPEPAWAAYVAIDWADQKHHWCLVSAASEPQQVGQLEGSPEAVDEWAMQLHTRFGGRPVAVCLEQKRGALVIQLAKYPHLVLFPVHPNTAALYRQTFCPSGAKDDCGDTRSLLDLLLKHRDQLRKLEPDTADTRLLKILVETRRRLVNEKTRQKNRFTACLKMYFPQLLGWFDSPDSAVVGALISKWGNLQELKRAQADTLQKFFYDHNCRGQQRIQERITQIRDAIPPTDDAAIVEGETMCARAYVALIEVLRIQIEQFDQRIEQLVAQHPDGTLFASLPGAGAALVPRLVVAFGTHRDYFDTAYQMQCLSGIAPVTYNSGDSESVCVRRACPRFLRQTFHEFAAQSIKSQRTSWPLAFYQQQRAKNNSHHAAIRTLAYRWIRIIFRCWKDNRPYDDQYYMDSLKRHHSPMSGKWENAAGFQKFSKKAS